MILQNIPQELYSAEQCQCCKQFTHNTFKCPSISIVPNRDLIIKRYIFSALQTRAEFKRRREKQNLSCLTSNGNIKKSLKEYRVDYLIKNQNEDLDLNLLQLDNQIIHGWDDKKFYSSIPTIKLHAITDTKKRIDESHEDHVVWDNDEYEDYEDEDEEEDEFDENIDTPKLQEEDQTESVKQKSYQYNMDQLVYKTEKLEESNSIQRHLRDVENVQESSLDFVRDKPQKNPSFQQFMNDSFRKVTLQNIADDMVESDLFGKNRNLKKNLGNRDSLGEGATGGQGNSVDMLSSKNITSKLDNNYGQSQGGGISTLANNLGSQMSGFTPSINTAYAPSQQSNYVHYAHKKKKSQQYSSQQLQSPQLQNQTLQSLIQLQQIQSSVPFNPFQQSATSQLNNLMNQQFNNNNFNSNSNINTSKNKQQFGFPFNTQVSQNILAAAAAMQTSTLVNNGTIIQSSYQQKPFDLYTRDTQPLENMNPFENQFDRSKDYKIYFPSFNLEKVLTQYKKKVQLRVKVPRYKKEQEDITSTRKRLPKKSTLGLGQFNFMSSAKFPLSNLNS